MRLIVIGLLAASLAACGARPAGNTSAGNSVAGNSGATAPANVAAPQSPAPGGRGALTAERRAALMNECAGDAAGDSDTGRVCRCAVDRVDAGGNEETAVLDCARELGVNMGQ